jgi:hypothetical protein
MVSTTVVQSVVQSEQTPGDKSKPKNQPITLDYDSLL